MPSTAAHRLTKKNISYLEHLCAQPRPINTTGPELTALLIQASLITTSYMFYFIRVLFGDLTVHKTQKV